VMTPEQFGIDREQHLRHGPALVAFV
jgi:hypothetical protein